MAPTAFVGGKLTFKSDQKSPKKAKRKSNKSSSKHRRKEKAEKKEDLAVGHASDDDNEMTEAERRSIKYKEEKERRDLEAVADLSHRERVEKYNEDLSKLTEHNDIPRVSAAGNG